MLLYILYIYILYILYILYYICYYTYYIIYVYTYICDKERVRKYSTFNTTSNFMRLK